MEKKKKNLGPPQFAGFGLRTRPDASSNTLASYSRFRRLGRHAPTAERRRRRRRQCPSAGTTPAGRTATVPGTQKGVARAADGSRVAASQRPAVPGAP